jgi:ABC-type transport system involved in multi-copper enzyme maturation permease subunit
VQARFGPGPVFVYEWLTTSRRWQLYASRAAFVCAILAGMIFVSWTIPEPTRTRGPNVSLQALANYGRTLYLAVTSIELTIVLLVAPAATAGAVCLDKIRGTLDHILATDLSNAEIVLGKLGVRLVPVLGMVACVLPIMAIAGLLGGIDPNALFGSFLVAIACATLGCSLALLLSVWGRKTHEVLMITYLLMILWLFSPFLLTNIFQSTGVSSLGFAAPLLWQWLESTNPYYLAWAPYTAPGSVSPASYLAFLGYCVGISGVFMAIATWKIRAVAQKQAGRSLARKDCGRLVAHLPDLAWQRLFPGPTLDGNPVFWREWYRSKPSKSMHMAWVLYGTFGVVSIVNVLQSLDSGVTSVDFIATLNVFQVGVGLLLLSVSAVFSLAEERMRGSLDVLLTTPLSTRSILVGKWGGAFRTVPQLLFAPAVTSVLIACESGRWIKCLLFLALLLAYSAMIVSMGLALATWLSRPGRAAASCVAGYVALSFGWPALVLALAGSVHDDDRVVLPLVFGSPLLGTLFGTLGLSGPHRMPGAAVDIGMGCVLWTAIFGALATFLFETTVATFDRCLGRVPETDLLPYSRDMMMRLPRFDPYRDDDVDHEPSRNPLDPANGRVEPRGSPQLYL